MKKSDNWYDVNRKGLSKLLEKRGKGFAIFELIQNAWDQNVKNVNVTLTPQDNRHCVEVVVEDDDPDGFSDLSHAYTLFAETQKRNNPEQRGRFNAGEKLVLAICESATVESTKGTIIFDASGRSESKHKRAAGSKFTGMMKMTRPEYKECIEAVNTLIPPNGIITMINGKRLKNRVPEKTAPCTLPTELADSEGYMRKTRRKTTVEIYKPQDGEQAHIYEMGIPIVAVNDTYHVNVLQKVPLNIERDNVTPAYLQELRVIVLNAMHQDIDTAEKANTVWVRAAAGDEKCAPEAFKAIITQRFGEKSVAFDPSDQESNVLSASRGYTVVSGRSMSTGEWDNARKSGALPSSGQVNPAKPFVVGTAVEYPSEKWTDGMRWFVGYAKKIAKELLDVDIKVGIYEDGLSALASYGECHLSVFVSQLGTSFFDKQNIQNIDALLIHEFGHHYESNHLGQKYYDAFCELGAKLKALALKSPELFA